MLRISPVAVITATVVLLTASVLSCTRVTTVPDEAQNRIVARTPVQPPAIPSASPQLPDETLSDKSPGATPSSENTTFDLQYLINADPATVRTAGLPVSRIEDLHTTGSPRPVDIEQYRLIVDGLVERELSLTYDRILGYPAVTDTILLICPYFFVDNAEWTGVPVSLLLNEAGVKAEAKKVSFIAVDGYGEDLALEDALQDGVFLAHTVNGQVLPPEHGFPLRLVAKGKYGNLWVKWIRHIEVIK